MSLLELKEYLQGRDIVSIDDLCIHFRTSPETLEPMLEQWIRKGKLRKETADSSCGGRHSTCSCGKSEQNWYQWIG
ncbi:MAG: FeoC-like transcriptional regulator [Chlorobiales bacterium]|nr:FeoC-like transcriptional regulator [Chlorobiales bacterium]